MPTFIADLVHAVFDYGLRLRDRLEAGAAVNLDQEQAILKKLLLTDRETSTWPDYGGSGVHDQNPPRKENEPKFQGIRYGLTCWLDELFLQYSPWETAWAPRKLEVALYGTDHGKWKFWQQACLAAGLPGNAAVAAYYQCVLLGFRGDFGKTPENVRHWMEVAQARLASSRRAPESPDLDAEPLTYVPPLRGRDRMQSMVFVCGMTLVVAIPVVVLLVARHF